MTDQEIAARLNCLTRYDLDCARFLGHDLVRRQYGDYIDAQSIADALGLLLDRGGVGFRAKEPEVCK